MPKKAFGLALLTLALALAMASCSSNDPKPAGAQAPPAPAAAPAADQAAPAADQEAPPAAGAAAAAEPAEAEAAAAAEPAATEPPAAEPADAQSAPPAAEAPASEPPASQAEAPAAAAPSDPHAGHGAPPAASAAPVAEAAAAPLTFDFGPPADANGFLKPIPRPGRFDESDDKIELVYFFWYGCGSCYKSDPATTMFLSSLPDDVRVVRLHALFDNPPYWRQHGRLFYVLDELGVERDLHTKVFETVHGRSGGGHSNLSLLTPEAQEAFAAAHGVSRAAFRAAYDSPDVQGRMERASAFADRIGLDGVPGMAINGRYQFTYMDGPAFYQQAEKLINLERQRILAEKGE